MNRRLVLMVLAGFVLLSMILASNSLAKTVYWRHDDPGNNSPPGNGWNSGPITLPGACNYLWLAMTNWHLEDRTKSWTIRIGPLGGHSLELENASDAFGGYNSYSGETQTIAMGSQEGDYYTITAFTSPQPDWEVVKLHQVSKGGEVIMTVDTDYGTSNCNKTTTSGGEVGIEESQHDNEGDSTRATEIMIFPATATVDQAILPDINAPYGSGMWTASFVDTDPEGNYHPNGGVCFTSDGDGIPAWTPYDIYFSMEGDADQTYWVYFYDAHDGMWKRLWLLTDVGIIPTLTEWGLIFFGILLAAWMAWMIMRRRRPITTGIR